MTRRSPGQARARLRVARAHALLLASALVTLGLAACESGPRGPGTFEASLDAEEALGAVTLEVVGRGILGFEGTGGTEAWGAVVSAAEGRHRVVLVNPTSGELSFRILVEDVGSELPAITVVDAAGTDDLQRLTGGIDVHLQR